MHHVKRHRWLGQSLAWERLDLWRRCGQAVPRPQATGASPGHNALFQVDALHGLALPQPPMVVFQSVEFLHRVRSNP